MLLPTLALSGVRNRLGAAAPSAGLYWTSNSYQAAFGTSILTTLLDDGVSGDQMTYVAYAPSVGVEANITVFRVWSTAQALNSVTFRALLGEALFTYEVERWNGSAWSNDIKSGVPMGPTNFQPTWTPITQNLNPALTTTMLRVSIKTRTDIGGGDGPVLRVSDLRTA